MRKALLAAILTIAVPALAQSGLTVDWEWKIDHRCAPLSPALSIAGVPADAKSIQVTMVDLDYRSFDHGGGTVPATGQTTVSVTEGALKDYRGPCPQNFANFGHDYEFTVRALAADGQTELARGSKTKTFSAATAK